MLGFVKNCAVSSCNNDSSRRPDLSFFNLPRDTYVKDEWLDVLRVKRGESTNNLKVCEVHFKPKDFCAGKKQLKYHAVPVLKLGAGKAENVDSDDEFIQCDSDSDPEIVEVKKVSAASVFKKRGVRIKTEEIDVKPEIKQEPASDDYDTGRRPSRRAAREAAKKIYNTVRNYGLSVEAEERPERPVVSSFKVSCSPRPYQRLRQRTFHHIKVPPVHIDLAMECHEELLSAAQAESLLKAQLEYNMVMKTLRSYKANNYKIICVTAHDAFPEKLEASVNDPGSKNDTVDASADTKPTNMLPKCDTSMVVPMELSSAVQSPSAPVIA